MIESKFRVWCKNSNEWEKNRAVIDMQGSLSEVLNSGRLMTLREDTHILQQCTGLKDKNGKEIYEGDLVEYEMEVNGEWETYEASEVVFDKTYGIFCFKNDSPSLLTDYKNLEVISNIYQNPKTNIEEINW